MTRLLPRVALAAAVLAAPGAGGAAPHDAYPQTGPGRSGAGPWRNDVLVFRLDPDGGVERLATFERAGVSTLARLADGRLATAHQHFPVEPESDFDTVAVRLSSDEGRTWTRPQVIRVDGLPDGLRFPFDPTLVPLPDGRVRLYFTSTPGRGRGVRPAIYSAVSSNAIDFVFERGTRFEIADRPVIDCAVVLHQGVFHLFAPDNGATRPGARGFAGEPGPFGVGYHATSPDGLTFARRPDVHVPGRRRWLGTAHSDGRVITFVGTGEPGLWMGTSADGERWTVDAPLRVPGADPGAVRLSDGAWLFSVTGPPVR